MPEITDDLEDYEAFKNQTNYDDEEYVREVEAKLIQLFTPKINLKFSSDSDDSSEVDENTFSLKDWIKSWFIKDDDSERGYHFITISERIAEFEKDRIEQAKKQRK